MDVQTAVQTKQNDSSRVQVLHVGAFTGKPFQLPCGLVVLIKH